VTLAWYRIAPRHFELRESWMAKGCEASIYRRHDVWVLVGRDGRTRIGESWTELMEGDPWSK